MYAHVYVCAHLYVCVCVSIIYTYIYIYIQKNIRTYTQCTNLFMPGES